MEAFQIAFCSGSPILSCRLCRSSYTVLIIVVCRWEEDSHSLRDLTLDKMDAVFCKDTDGVPPDPSLLETKSTVTSKAYPYLYFLIFVPGPYYMITVSYRGIISRHRGTYRGIISQSCHNFVYNNHGRLTSLQHTRW